MLASALLLSCSSDDSSPVSPSPAPGPSSPAPAPAPAAQGALRIEDFVATVAADGGSATYRASLDVRETGGAAVTITGLTLTLGLVGGGNISRDFGAADAFASTAVTANGSQPSRPLTVTAPPVQANQLTARIAYADANGRTGATEATTNIVPAG